MFDSRLRFKLCQSQTVDINHSTMDFHYFFNVAPDQQLIYIEVLKAGCTTIKNLLATCLYGRQLSNPHDIHARQNSGLLGPSDIGLSRFESLLYDPQTLVFTVVREPFSRLRSCYLDKIARPNHVIISTLMGDRAHDKPISFETFVRRACATAETTDNGHWAPMSRIVPMSSGVNIRVIKLENLSHELSPVLDRLDASPAIRDSITRPLNAAGRAHIFDAEWTEPLKDEVRKAYTADFALFGYDPG